jgi:hypothetical protein
MTGQKVVTGQETWAGKRIGRTGPHDWTEGCHGKETWAGNRIGRTGPHDWTEGCHGTGDIGRIRVV